MTLPAYLGQLKNFEKELLSCEEILGEGRLLVAPLDGCSKYPTFYTVKCTAALTTADTTALLQLTAPVPGTLKLSPGDVLSFLVSSAYVEVTVAAAATITDTAPVSVSIEAPAAAVTLNALAEAYQRFEFIGLKTLPLDFQIGTEDVKILRDGIQGKTTKTNISPQMGVEFLLRLDDLGFWEQGLVYDSATTNRRFYGLALRLNEQHFITGPMETTALSFQDQTAQIQKATGTIVLQPTWYEGRIYALQSVAQKAAYNAVRRLWMLPALV
jgi:hypothetical protein